MKIRIEYVDPATDERIVLEKADDGLVPPPTIVLHRPLVGEVVYHYSVAHLTDPS